MVRATILIATHNYGHFIYDCLNSVKGRSIVVVDDGSTDNTEEVVNLWKSNNADTTLKYIKLGQAYGPSFARNVGIQETWDDTDVWFVLDADDEFLPSKYEQFCEKFKDINIGIVYGDYVTVNENGLILRNYKEPYSRRRLFQECIIHSGSAFSKIALERIGLTKSSEIYKVDMRTAEDWDLWLRLTKKSLAYHIPEALTKVRTGNYNSTNTVNKEVWQDNWRKISENMRNGVY